MENIFLFIQQEVLLVAALCIVIIAFFWRDAAAAGKKMSQNEVVQAMNANNAVLIDVREKKDFEKGHIASSINIPYQKVEQSLNLLDKHKDKCLIIADNMGQHAGTVSRSLAKKGFTVSRMQGGMSEWNQQGLPLVK